MCWNRQGQLCIVAVQFACPWRWAWWAVNGILLHLQWAACTEVYASKCMFWFLDTWCKGWFWMLKIKCFTMPRRMEETFDGLARTQIPFLAGLRGPTKNCTPTQIHHKTVSWGAKNQERRFTACILVLLIAMRTLDSPKCSRWIYACLHYFLKKSRDDFQGSSTQQLTPLNPL